MTKRIVVTGATGLLGGYVVAELRRRRFEVVSFGGPSRERALAIDLVDEKSARDAIEKAAPSFVIHCAALSAMADCARDPERARRINVDGTRHVALACHAVGARLVHVSTDLVFDGEAAPYKESDSPTPISVYGRTKLEAEHAAQTVMTNEASEVNVVRVSLLFGPTLTARLGFFDSQLDAFTKKGATITLFEDEWRTPLSLHAAAEGLVALAAGDHEADLPRVIHLGGPERMSRLEMGEQLRDLVAPGVTIQKGSRLSVPGEPRPRDVSLDSSVFRRAFPEIAKKSFREEALEMMAVNTKRESV